jgi:hypothetical protein
LGSSSAHHQEFSTVHSALVYVMQVWWQFSSTTRMELKFHAGGRILYSQIGQRWPCKDTYKICDLRAE